MSDGSDGRMMPVATRVARMVARIEWCQRKIAVLERELAEAQQAIDAALESVRALGVDGGATGESSTPTPGEP